MAAGWPGTLKQENSGNDIPPFWAQLAAANQSVCPIRVGDNSKVNNSEISGSEDMYGERRGRNASSVRSYASSSSFHHLRDEDPMLSSYSSNTKRSSSSKAPHTISKSPSLDDHDMDNSNEQPRTADNQSESCVAKDLRFPHPRSSSPAADPIDVDLPTPTRGGSDMLLSRDLPPRDMPQFRNRKHSLSLSPLPFAVPPQSRGRSVSDVTYTAEALADVRRKRLLPHGDRLMDMEPKVRVHLFVNRICF